MNRRPVCLTIGGSDSCGGAGIQADLRIFEALDVRGCSVTTALTAQNPNGICRIEAVSLAQLDAELHTLFDYYDIAVVKTGMLLDAEHIAVVSAALHGLHDGGLVIDPVMLSSSGKRLLQASAVDALTRALVPQATLLTPNLDEAAVLLGAPVADPVSAASELSSLLGCAVLLKGGHQAGEILVDVLCEQNGSVTEFTHCRQTWSLEQRHGTGCRLASAIAANLAHQLSLPQAVEKGVSYLQEEISLTGRN